MGWAALQRAPHDIIRHQGCILWTAGLIRFKTVLIRGKTSSDLCSGKIFLVTLRRLDESLGERETVFQRIQ